MDQTKFIVSNQKKESISIQRVNRCINEISSIVLDLLLSDVLVNKLLEQMIVELMEFSGNNSCLKKWLCDKSNSRSAACHIFRIV